MGKRLSPLLPRGTGRQGCHFYGEFLDRQSGDDPRLLDDRVLQKSQLRGPGRGTRQKDNPTGVDARQANLATQGFRKGLAQLAIQGVQSARARKQRGDGAAFTDGFGGEAWLRWARGCRLHGAT